MTWIILTGLALSALWIAAGVILLARNSRPAGKDYRRRTGGRVYRVGEEIEVELRLVPPARMGLAEDHDVLLVIDHSSSMGSAPGSPLREAVRAAENFVRRLPDNIHTGVMGFDHEARLLSPLTGSSRQSLRAIGSLGPGGGTAIHTALESSNDALRGGRAGVRKTIILLSDGSSDQAQAEAAAQKLRREIERLTIISVGFGPNVNESLLRSIAGDPNKYLHVKNADELHDLFSFLAAAVSGQMAVAGLIDEGARAPHPFRLLRTGGLYPIGVQPPEALRPDATRIVWSIPLMSEEPVPLTYNLVAECPGWHRVAAASNSTWRMPDGSRSEMPGPSGPYVLIMPRWLGWTWPVLNPLFWILFGRFWRCGVKAAETVSLPEPEPLPIAELPALPPAPSERAYQPKIRPAVVIGLGEVGEWTLCRLKERLQDRKADPATVSLLAIHVTHQANRRPAQVVNTILDPHEQIDIHQDLRPYLETLRKDGTPSLRRWVPWRQWLAETQPLTTLRTVAGDRRKARLALIRRPEPVETRLQSGLQRVFDNDGIVIVVGSIADAECSGLLAEIAHICAARGTGVTAVFAPTSFFETPTTSVLALALELERICLMSGSRVVSDRHDPPVAAERLFDRLIVLDQQQEGAAEASRPAAELLWTMLAYEDVFKQIPLVESQGGDTICCLAEIESHRIPAGSLWNWVRERTLALGINGQRLGLTENDGKLVLPDTDREAVNNDVEAFWSGQYCERPQSLLLHRLRPSLQSNSEMVSTLLTLQDVVPFDLPYHEQVIHTRNERQVFAAYLEEWCQKILAREQERNVWGLHVLLPALLRVADDVQLSIDSIKRLSGNPDFANLISFASGLLLDFLSVISKTQNDLSLWMARLVGPRLDLQVDPPPDGIVPLAYDIEEERQLSDKLLISLSATEQKLLNEWFKEWFEKDGDQILDQLGFRASREPGSLQVSIKLYYAERELNTDSDLAGALRSTLDRYSSLVLGWPIENMLSRGKELVDAQEYFRVGKYSALAYPEVRKIADEGDPFIAAAIRVRTRSLKQALGVDPPPVGEIPYVWPEEANAARIADKIRNRLKREPQSFSPTVVHLMRDTNKLYGFINDLAHGRVSTRESKYILKRNGEEFEIGPGDERLQGLDAFQNVVQQVVSWEVSLNGQPLPPPSSTNATNSFDETMQAVETHSLSRMATNSPSWKMWRDVIHGLLLEHNGDSH